MKVLSFVKVRTLQEVDGTQYYRQVAPLKAVHGNSAGIEVTCMIQGDVEALEKAHGPMLVEKEMEGFDVYAYPRMIHADCGAFLDVIHEQGAVLTIDADDDLTEDYKLVSGLGREFKQVLRMVDRVTVSTPALADRLAQYTRQAPVVLLNCVDVEWMQSVAGTAKRLIDGLTIGFSGSPTHWGDWYLPSVPFQRICQDYPVTPILHGETPRYLEYAGDGIIKIAGVPYCVYPMILAQFDMLLCAVDAGDPFNSGKSAVKALEAMAVGVIPICSRFEPYLALEAQGAPVVVVEEDTRDGWYETMRDLIQDPNRRKELQATGADWVREHRDIKTGYKQWENFFRQIGPSS